MSIFKANSENSRSISLKIPKYSGANGKDFKYMYIDRMTDTR